MAKLEEQLPEIPENHKTSVFNSTQWQKAVKLVHFPSCIVKYPQKDFFKFWTTTNYPKTMSQIFQLKMKKLLMYSEQSGSRAPLTIYEGLVFLD